MSILPLLCASWAATLVQHVVSAPIDQSAYSFDMPLTWTPFGFTTDAVSIGTPRQQVTCFVDWTWVSTYVFTPLCHGSMTRTTDCLHEDQIIFNQTKSTTFINQSAIYPELNWNPNHFFFYDDLSVQYGQDIEQVGPHSAATTIMAADMHFKLPFAYPFSGVFGLSPVFKGDNVTIQSPFYQMLHNGAYKSSIVAFEYCYNATFGNPAPPRSACKGHDGLQTLGGYRPQSIKGDITWYDNIVFPEVNVVVFVYEPALLNYWATGLTKHLIGDEEQPLNATEGAAAIFDHASYGRGAPMSMNSYNRLIELTGAKLITLEKELLPNNGNQSFYTVDCDTVSTLPPLKYQLAGSNKLWSIIPENYVEKIEVATGTVCTINVRILGEGDFIIGNFGETFAKDKVVLFDFEEMKVGIADVLY